MYLCFWYYSFLKLLFFYYLDLCFVGRPLFSKTFGVSNWILQEVFND